MYWLNHLIIYSILIFGTLAKPQYDSLPEVNSGSSSASTNLPNQIVRVEGEVHAEKAEENKILGGLHPPGFGSSTNNNQPPSSKKSPNSLSSKNAPNRGLINDGRSKSSPSSSYDGSSPSKSVENKPSSKPTENMLPENKPSSGSKKGNSQPGQANAKSQPTAELNPYDGNASAASEPIKASNSPSKPGFIFGGNDQSTTNLPSETTSNIENSTNSYESTTGTSESTSSFSTNEGEITQSSVSSFDSSASTTTEPNGSIEEQNDQTNSNTSATTPSESYESQEHTTSEPLSNSSQPFTSESELFETTSQSPTSPGSEEALSVIDDNSGSSETSTTQNPSSTTQQNSYETEIGSSSPTPPTEETSVKSDEASTLPPAFEPSSPGTTPQKTYDQTTPSSIEASQTDSSISDSSTQSVNLDEQSTIIGSTTSESEIKPTETSDAHTSGYPSQNNPPDQEKNALASENQESSTLGYESSTQSSTIGEQNTGSTFESTEGTTTEPILAPVINTSLPGSRPGDHKKGTSQSSSYNSDSPSSSILSKPINDADTGKSDNLPSASQPVPETPDNSLPPSQQQPTSKSPNYESSDQSKKPNSKPRAWKISQGNAVAPIDGNTNDSDGSANTKPESTIDSNKDSNSKLQPSGYGENEVKSEAQKASLVVSPKDAVGYDGIVDAPASMAQRDPVVDRAEVSINQPTKKVDPSARKKWQRYRFDCELEVDDRGEELCREWARGGLCEHRSTMFLFCRKTCLCVGPPEEDEESLKESRKRRRRTQGVRL